MLRTLNRFVVQLEQSAKLAWRQGILLFFFNIRFTTASVGPPHADQLPVVFNIILEHLLNMKWAVSFQHAHCNPTEVIRVKARSNGFANHGELIRLSSSLCHDMPTFPEAASHGNLQFLAVANIGT